MAYEVQEIKLSQRIFYYLIEHRELQEDVEIELYKAYTENENIRNLVKSQGEIAECMVERYGNVIYLIPKEENNYLGFSKKQLKAVLCKSNGTEKDYYLSQFVIITLLVEFYRGQGSSSKSRSYLRVGELMNCVTDQLKIGVDRAKEIEMEEDNSAIKSEERMEGVAFQDMYEAFEALRSEERGSRAKSTKEGFLYGILNFLQRQGLIDFVEADEMIYTTSKLDRFMDWNLLNKNNYDRVLRVLGVTENE
ncbi:DUF6063 family protein [Anaeromicropila herbilytica]|uniref:Uncharacterized protein n=1 Tax=Anaeromicropila herbilytica TaxID=2785025 RepID=A0A7R7ELV2_9FIRM|nr:DUF6063 family protein [Anaeromicropila herbilytica]BCN31345.1 hypothetical protein bsdtb5_26400 [Anaeromicropila herbilytica]